MGEKNKRLSVYHTLLKLISGNKQWWLTPVLVVFLLSIIIILYLIRYKPSEFIYSLF